MCASLNLQGSSYLGQMAEWAARDEPRPNASKSISPPPIAFSNLPFPPKISFPLFEAKAALAVPSKYYQPLSVDDVPLRNDWAHDFCRSVGFVDGSLLLISQAIAKKPQGEAFLHYLAVKFSKSEFSFNDSGNGKFQISASNVSREGVDLLSGSPASHSFSFSFTHNPTKMATMSSTSFRASGLSSSVYGKHGGLARSTEESVITVAHLEPHPYLLADFAALGYKSRRELLNDTSALLAGYLQK